VIKAQHLPSMDMMGKCDGLVEMSWQGQTHKTTHKKQTYDPEWNEVCMYILPLTATDCNTLEHTVTRCNTHEIDP